MKYCFSAQTLAKPYIQHTSVFSLWALTKDALVWDTLYALESGLFVRTVAKNKTQFWGNHGW